MMTVEEMLRMGLLGGAQGAAPVDVAGGAAPFSLAPPSSLDEATEQRRRAMEVFGQMPRGHELAQPGYFSSESAREVTPARPMLDRLLRMFSSRGDRLPSGPSFDRRWGDAMEGIDQAQGWMRMPGRREPWLEWMGIRDQKPLYPDGPTPRGFNEQQSRNPQATTEYLRDMERAMELRLLQSKYGPGSSVPTLGEARI